MSHKVILYTATTINTTDWPSEFVPSLSGSVLTVTNVASVSLTGPNVVLYDTQDNKVRLSEASVVQAISIKEV